MLLEIFLSAMKSTFKHPVSIPAIAILAIGLFTATTGLAAQARDSSDPANQTSPTQTQPIPTAPETPAPSPQPSPRPSQPSRQSANPMQSSEVDVEDVYPEYCRMYFPSPGTVSLFDYRERIYRCLYGPDRRFF